ncbi:MAG: hypothetical protein K8R58_07280, partial [Bacteroidales bacterium]|nr:hypothetical protein [Bacteroidales bacterium]
MKNIILSLFFSLLLFQLTYSQQVNGVILSDTANITIVKVWGTHQERGFAYGYLVAEKIEEMYYGYILPHFGTLLPYAKSVIQEGVHITIDSLYVEEAKAVISGIVYAGIDTTGVDYLDILVSNSFLDLEGLGG